MYITFDWRHFFTSHFFVTWKPLIIFLYFPSKLFLTFDFWFDINRIYFCLICAWADSVAYNYHIIIFNVAFMLYYEIKLTGYWLMLLKVDRHPQFKRSRCLFVVRTDGGWIDFSYQKCLRAYIRDKYPSHSERFIKEHFKRGSG